MVELNLDSIEHIKSEDTDYLEELTSSVKILGVRRPINVYLDGDKYKILDGIDRVNAARLAGLETIPANVTNKQEVDSLLHSVVESQKHVKTTPEQMAKGIRNWLKLFPQDTLTDIARQINKSESWLRDLLDKHP